jgi:hypothetical protein
MARVFHYRARVDAVPKPGRDAGAPNLWTSISSHPRSPFTPAMQFGHPIVIDVHTKAYTGARNEA